MKIPRSHTAVAAVPVQLPQQPGKPWQIPARDQTGQSGSCPDKPARQCAKVEVDWGASCSHVLHHQAHTASAGVLFFLQYRLSKAATSNKGNIARFNADQP